MLSRMRDCAATSLVSQFLQALQTAPTLCRRWTWRENLCLSWELDHQGATVLKLSSFWSMSKVFKEYF